MRGKKERKKGTHACRHVGKEKKRKEGWGWGEERGGVWVLLHVLYTVIYGLYSGSEVCDGYICAFPSLYLPYSTLISSHLTDTKHLPTPH